MGLSSSLYLPPNQPSENQEIVEPLQTNCFIGYTNKELASVISNNQLESCRKVLESQS